MKKFTCREMGGPCNEVHEGETAMEIAMKSHAHVMATTDEAHKQMREQMREQMTKGSKEGQKKWWDWFNGEWSKKVEA